MGLFGKSNKSNNTPSLADDIRKREAVKHEAAENKKAFEARRAARQARLKNWVPPKGLINGGDVRFNRNLLDNYLSVSRAYEFYAMFDLNADVTNLVNVSNSVLGESYSDMGYPLTELKDLILNNQRNNAMRLMVAVQSTNLSLTQNYEEHEEKFGDVALPRLLAKYAPLDGNMSCNISMVDNAYNFLTALDSIQAKCTLDINGRYFEYAIANPFLLKIMKYSGGTHTVPESYNGMMVQATLDNVALNPSKGMNLGYTTNDHVTRSYKALYRRISYDKYTL